eukprot:CAMPEP_0175965456 /NCGR_PEP_ID=MMETSP0108-20121206/38122_1 /TAXON_ID=195067 ORGANISM="Goniomonas pacifica, Strain CCMP1869" /NCGR_SAMPLE_ID=MMETSP0108 /ASSEMBLY_ACC=CAM_ASM_000204 /LENGTH=58 /DNA_ID=CAMNT_0017293541 /DNA_START=557 /DNA_END=729 /DNA_ORIENTATION=+
MTCEDDELCSCTTAMRYVESCDAVESFRSDSTPRHDKTDTSQHTPRSHQVSCAMWSSL